MILLDTHVALWQAASAATLSVAALRLVEKERADGGLATSSPSPWPVGRVSDSA